MSRIHVLFVISLVIVLLSGCTSHDLYIHGKSSILSYDWKSQIQTGQTSEKELINLLGQPTAYYHRYPNVDEKYLLYSSIATIAVRRHYPFFPKAQFTSKQIPYETRVWFLVSKGIVAKQILLEKDPDLNDFIASSSSEYPHCENSKCKLNK